MKKIVLGLNLFHADSSACLFINNVLISAVEEERFTRIKHCGGLPVNAIKFCLNYSGITLSDVNVITINQNKKENIFQKIKYVILNKISYKLISKSLKYSIYRKNFKNLLSKLNLGNFNGKIIGIEHHLSHIGSSFYPSGFQESACVSIDGFGDFVSTALGYAKNNEIVLHDKIFFPHSLGIFYQAITQYIGFTNYGDEYKMMGLSSYGEPIYEKKISEIIKYLGNGKFKLNLDYFTHHQDDYAMNFDSLGNPIIKNLY